MSPDGQVSGRFGDPAGRAVTATLTVYAALIALLLGSVVVGIMIRSTLGYVAAAFSRVFHVIPSPAMGPKPLLPARPQSGSANESVRDAFEESDSGTASCSNAPTHVLGRRACQSHCVWLSGRQTEALPPISRTGKRVKPSKLMYDDWFIQYGERVRSAKFPLAAELCAQHRLDYAEQKPKPIVQH